jgi:hypothetical protein
MSHKNQSNLPKPFWFWNVSNQEVAEVLDQEYPIKLTDTRIIDRIHAQYPIIPKHEVAMIVRACFEVLRARLILGDLIRIKGFLIDLFLRCSWSPQLRTVWLQNKNGKALMQLTVRTPKGLQ